MIKNFKAIIPVMVATLFIIPAFSHAMAVEDNGNASSEAIVSEDNGNASSETIVSEDNGNASHETVVSEDNGNASHEVSPTPSNSGSNGGSSSGSSSRRRSSSSGTRTAVTLANLADCSYINEYMKLGGKNSVTEITKLQTFLKDVEKLNVTVTGNFDAQTVEAVKAFQAKYVNDVMAPWGVTTPTGQVFYTTKKKINEIYCKSNFALTPAQIAEIEAYKKGTITKTVVDTTAPVNVSAEVGTIATTSTSTLDTLTANASFGSKVGKFFKWLFGY